MASTGTTRAPNGTKNVAKAFFAAAAEIPEARRTDVLKAAFAMIRDQIKVSREKAAADRVTAKGKTLTATARKKIGRPQGSKNKVAKVASVGAKTGGVTAKRGRRAPARRPAKNAPTSITEISAE